jgi:hypothetical protein
MVVVRSPNWDMAECVLEVKFDHQGTSAGKVEVRDGVLEHIVRNVSFNVGNTVIDGGATRPRQVVDHAKLARLALALNSTER